VAGKKIDLTIKSSEYESSLLPLNMTVTADRDGGFLFKVSAWFTKNLRKKQFIISSSDHDKTPMNQDPDPDMLYYYGYQSQSHYVKAWVSPSDSYIVIEKTAQDDMTCKVPAAIHFQYSSKTELPQSAKFHYQLTASGNLVASDAGLTQRGSAKHGEDVYVYNFIIRPNLPQDKSSLGNLNLLVFYIRPDGEIIADSWTTSFDHCFKNNVSGSFADSKVQPGHETSLNLKADPDSLCSVVVVDKSIKLMGAKYMTPSSVKELLKSRYELSSTDYSYRHGCVEGAELEPEDLPPPGGRRPRRSYMYGGYSQSVDSQKPFEDLGLLILTDLLVKTRPCQRVPYHMEFASVPRLGVEGPIPMRKDQIHTVEARVPAPAPTNEKGKGTPAPTLHRTFFPETWLWDLHTVGSSGQQKVPVTIPHTITEWIGNGYCVSPQTGLGVSPPFTITAFQPFFVSFTLPYSVIRGEEVAVPVSVFNYLTTCLKVTLVVQQSSSFTLVNETSTARLKVCGQETQVFTFFLVPRQIGQINFTVEASSVSAKPLESNSDYTADQTTASDVVTRKLLVEAEGKPEELTHSAFVCGAGGGDWTFTLPPDIVQDSTRAEINVIGDVMGPALSGLDSLLRMPMGCGEQNMLLFAPNIYVMQYLNKTRRLTPDIEKKALSHMQTGYQRELTYRHDDGSYSAFGKSDPEGSIWLTAFVIKSFAQAKPYMYIDEKDLKISVDWMVSKQLENGCFPQIGKVLHKAMMGGAKSSDTAPLTAFILVSLLEAGLDSKLPVIRNAIGCLNAHSVDDVYTLSLLAYAYSVVGDNSSQRAEVIRKLERKAIVKDGTTHWEADAPPPAEDSYYHSSPANVEATAYVLLSSLQGADISVVPSATQIVRWLTSQRNANGGFSSTQDTVLALQALAIYAGLVHRDDINLNIRMAANGANFAFKIDKTNSLLLQKKEGLPTHSRVHYSVDGLGCALLQASVKFNRLSITKGVTPNFAITVEVQDGKGSPKKCSQRQLNICAKYTGSDSKSNMAVIALKMVSGWIPDKTSIEKLKNVPRLGLKRFEVDMNAVQFYFDEFDKRERCFVISIDQDQQVADSKPAVAHIYDYYAPSSAAFTQYSIEGTCLVRGARSSRPLKIDQPINTGDTQPSTARPGRTSTPAKTDRPSKTGRPTKAAKTDRPETTQGPARTDRWTRTERPTKTERPDKTGRPRISTSKPTNCPLCEDVRGLAFEGSFCQSTFSM